jgi:hypothetical protein
MKTKISRQDAKSAKENEAGCSIHDPQPTTHACGAAADMERPQ